jgi:hypothetical protein
MIVAVQHHAGQGNNHREQGDGHPADPTESLAEPFAQILGALQETVCTHTLGRATGFALAAELTKGGWGRE